VLEVGLNWPPETFLQRPGRRPGRSRNRGDGGCVGLTREHEDAPARHSSRAAPRGERGGGARRRPARPGSGRARRRRPAGARKAAEDDPVAARVAPPRPGRTRGRRRRPLRVGADGSLVPAPPRHDRPALRDALPRRRAERVSAPGRGRSRRGAAGSVRAGGGRALRLRRDAAQGARLRRRSRDHAGHLLRCRPGALLARRAHRDGGAAGDLRRQARLAEGSRGRRQGDRDPRGRGACPSRSRSSAASPIAATRSSRPSGRPARGDWPVRCPWS
jgi:hypothetical protein